MALDVYFKDNIAQNALAGCYMACCTAAACGAANIQFVAGVLTMARFSLLATGVSLPAFTQALQDALSKSGETIALELLEQTMHGAIPDRAM